ncbi:MAG: M48 family metallopeptidase [Actinomycetota bacterium]|nr:M48 family metallopeptidase [Actinomycetota bacterium]
MAVSFRAEQSANQRKTWALLGLMFVAVIAIVWAIASLFGLQIYWIVPLAVGISLIGVWTSYWKSDSLVLAMTSAKIIEHSEAPQLYNIVEEVCVASGLPMPRIAIVDDPAPNAFATGRDPEHAVIAFTTGILQVMDREQLQGIAAHEMAHVGNRDTLVMAVAATTAGLLAIVADVGARMAIFGGGRNSNNNNPIAMILAIAILVLAPIAALLLRASISRKREALADATAVQFTRNPAGLRRALETLAADGTVVHQKSTAVAHVWIESPLDGKSKSMFDTHPPIGERIALLREMEGAPPAAE